MHIGYETVSVPFLRIVRCLPFSLSWAEHQPGASAVTLLGGWIRADAPQTSPNKRGNNKLLNCK
jgi:hypothetical protein